MGTVTVYDATRMKQIEDETIVSGEVDAGGNLILTTREGTSYDAGHVRGEDATALLSIEDTETIDLHLSGSGTPASPWLLKADVKDLRTNAEKTYHRLIGYDSTLGGWLTKGGDNVTYGPFNVSRSYLPIPGDMVWLSRDSFGDLVISGAENEWRPVPFLTNAVEYNANNVAKEWGRFEYKVRHGFVALRGLLALSIAGPGTLLGILPEGARPDKDFIFKVDNSAVIRSLYIRANGRIETGGSATINGFYSVDGIVFPVAGKANWTYVGDPGSGLAFANGWGHYVGGTSNFGKVGLWKDEYDFVWMCGLIAGGTVTGNTNMIVITNPDFYPWSATSPAANGEQHLATTSADGLGGLNVNGQTGNYAIRCGGAAPNNSAWISLSGQCYMTNAAYNHADWVEHPGDRVSGGGWVRLNNLYPSFAWRQRPDGMVILKGLIAIGAINSTLDFLPESCMTDYQQLMSTFANGGYARLDIVGRKSSGYPGYGGAIQPRNGSNDWFSLDMIKWFPD